MRKSALALFLATPLLAGLDWPPQHHAIVGGFNLRWVKPQGQNGEVALSAGSAWVDGQEVHSVSPSNDSLPIVPTFPPGINPVVGQTYAAYCYILWLAGGSVGPAWFANPTYWDFKCMVGSAYRPTPDGHPTTAIPYPGGPAPSSLFVGSVVGQQLAGNALYYGNFNAGFSVLPFFRNGSQVIYATQNACPKCLQSEWDLGIPTTPAGPQFLNPIPLNSESAVSPMIIPIDFTADGAANPLPLSATAIILDSEGHAHEGVDTLCFLDPNQAAFGGISPQSRSCQSELQLDSDFGAYVPMTPFRTHVNIGQSTTAGNGYGEIWVGVFCNPGPTGMLTGKSYFDLSYRGYLEPERQLVSQLPVP